MNRAPRFGESVVAGLVDRIVSGAPGPGELLPTEPTLCEEFGVSRTIVRESVKRLQEKGLVRVQQGRGTTVTPFDSWNVLDPIVLDALIRHDASLGVLDELSVVRSQLESAMAGSLADSRTEMEVARMSAALEAMEAVRDDAAEFALTDVAFHRLLMDLSGNRLASTIARGLLDRARESRRYNGDLTPETAALTLAEHAGIVDAIRAGDRERAESAVRDHILDSWRRRRPPGARARSLP